MSHRICLTTDYRRAGFPMDGSAVWVHHPDDAPEVERSVPAPEFVKAPSKYLEGAEWMVLLNLVSKIIRPGSRKQYGQFLTDPWNKAPRLSVDTHLYIEEPWRMWFHFGAVDAPFGTPDEKYHTSYRVQTDWGFYLEGKGPHPCGLDRLKRYGAGVVQYLDGFRFEDVRIETAATGPLVHAMYADEKEAAFNEERTPAAIIKRLAAFAQERCPERSVPRSLFADRRLRVVFTDLGVDRYLKRMTEDQVALTNGIAEAFRGSE